VDPIHQSYAEAWRARCARNELAARARADAARRLLPEAARILRDDFGADRVGVFGSLLGGRLAPESDVDLFVDAVRRGRYWQALAQLTELFGRDVDLVELERAPPSLRATIDAEGIDVA